MACKSCESACTNCEDLGTGSENCQNMDNYITNNLDPNADYIQRVPDCSFKQTISKMFKRVNCLFKNIVNNICAIWDKLGDLEEAINQINNSISVNGKIESPRIIDTTDNPKLITPVDLGEVTDETRIGITWHSGSTRDTALYTVADLKGNSAHITGTNLSDSENVGTTVEVFTKIKDGHYLWITALHRQVIYEDTIDWTDVPWDEDGNVYYDEQDPSYASNTDEYLIIDYVTVYDLIDPVTIS